MRDGEVVEGNKSISYYLPKNYVQCVHPAGVYSTSLNLANECTYTVWPAVDSGHGTPPLTTTIFMLEPGESASLLIPPSRSGQLWACTLCSYGLTGRFNCLTGDCGTGSEECASAQTVPPVTGWQQCVEQLDYHDKGVLELSKACQDLMIVKQLFASLSSKKWDSNQGKCNILLWNVESWGSLPSQSHKRLLMQDQTGYEEKCLGRENPSNSVLNDGQHQDEVAEVDA
ncbi:hypothetical protein RJ640_003685 [Escallonia rubra]|uniref:Uncharacterized protein n=1 Tax=Escallonia rubra TaxID=112253 RepID=A0AA88QUP8_9ASTE|nr:hypothetical protein RJ640_003685 [Escallonia rubra]